MKKSNNNTWKRIAAGALSLALVAGALPANVGGLLTGGKVLVASAAYDENTKIETISLYDDEFKSGNAIINGQYVDVSGWYSYDAYEGIVYVRGLSTEYAPVAINANQSMPENYVIKNVSFNVQSGYDNVNKGSVTVSSGTVQ